MSKEKDMYFVAVKLFLLNEKGELLITEDIFDQWDLPGGRLRKEDFETKLEDVVKRKVVEELGENVSYKLKQPVVFMRHEREEILSEDKKEKRRIFAVGYEADFLAGEVVLGRNHRQYKWVSLNEFKPEEYFQGGWLRGVQEYLDIKNK